IYMAYFLFVCIPVVIVPPGVAIFKLMWILAPLEGQTTRLLDNYKNHILPYAIGPGIFFFMSHFVFAVVRALPNAIVKLEPGLPLALMVLIASFIIVFIAFYAWKFLTKSFELARHFLQASL